MFSWLGLDNNELAALGSIASIAGLFLSLGILCLGFRLRSKINKSEDHRQFNERRESWREALRGYQKNLIKDEVYTPYMRNEIIGIIDGYESLDSLLSFTDKRYIKKIRVHLSLEYKDVKTTDLSDCLSHFIKRFMKQRVIV